MTKTDSKDTQSSMSRRTVVATAGAAVTVAAMMPVNSMAQDTSSPTVMITGSNRGIGLEFARQYTAADWTVIATCRKPEKADDLQALAAENDNVTIERLDVLDHDRIQKLAEKYQDTPIDVLLNNAAAFTNIEGQSLNGLDFDAFQLAMNVNIFGPLKMAQAFTEHVAKSEQKKIVSISSGLGSMTIGSVAGGGMYPYKISKAGLNMAMLTLRGDLKERGIIVGLLAPGMVDTKLLADSGWTGPSLSPVDSAAAVIKNIEAMTLESTGRSVNYDGQPIPW